MRQLRGAPPIVTPIAIVTVMTGAILLGAASAASAHVVVSPQTAPPGSFLQLTFRAPNENATAKFTKLVVHLPAAHPLGSLNAHALAGWTITTSQAKLAKPIVTDDGTTTEYTSEVTWTAAAGGGIPPEQYENFDLDAGPLPAKGTMTFTVDQFYADGTVVHWDQVAKAGAAEPEHPAPVLTVASDSSGSSSDGVARGLAIAGLVLGGAALGGGLVFVRRGPRGSA